jgi:hypothetical protein
VSFGIVLRISTSRAIYLLPIIDVEVSMPEKKSILLRLSPRMWEEISKWADDEFRSVNGQIEYILSEALRKRNSVGSKSKDMDRRENDEMET